MHRIARWGLRALPGVVGLLALAAGPGHAQAHRTVVGVFGGWSAGGDLTPGTGFESRLADGWLAGAQLESWSASERTGWRLTGTLASRALDGGGPTFTVIAADVALVLRILDPARERVAEPFVALGPGVVVYRAGPGEEPLGRGLYGSDPVARVVLAPSVGVDLRAGPRAGLRLEVVDAVVFPYVGISPASDHVRWVHNPGARVAAKLRFGQRPPPHSVAPVPVRAAPPARDAEPAAKPTPLEPPATTPTPTPTPTPRSEPAPPVPFPAPAELPLFTVQVGAFAEPGAARDLAGRLDGAGLPVWLAEREAGEQRLIAVRAGAVRSREEAALLARRLALELGVETWVAAVASGEPVPADAVATTLRILFPR
jgi:cell division septation protein DedD